MTKFQRYILENANPDIVRIWEAVKDTFPEPTSAGLHESVSEMVWDDGVYQLLIDRDDDGLCWIFRDRKNDTMVGGEPLDEHGLYSEIEKYAAYFNGGDVTTTPVVTPSAEHLASLKSAGFIHILGGKESWEFKRDDVKISLTFDVVIEKWYGLVLTRNKNFSGCGYTPDEVLSEIGGKMKELVFTEEYEVKRIREALCQVKEIASMLEDSSLSDWLL